MPPSTPAPHHAPAPDPAAFPPDFTFGVATSAYQIEGAVDADGRTPSVWDTFCLRPGAIAGGDDGTVACDHYRRWPDDLALLADLGVGAYRFSVAWSRVQPAPGTVNAAGLDHYERLVDRLLEVGVAPVVNLFHWDHPQWLEDAGGWLERDGAARFGEYADAVAGRLGDRVAMWSTLNEPFEHFTLGHVLGRHAPGHTLPVDRAAAVAHHLLLAHGTALGTLRARSAAPVMLINSHAPARPASDAEADVAMAGLYDVLQNRLFTDAVLLGRYPDELAPLLEPYVADGDAELIGGPLDALGVNYYTVNAVRATGDETLLDVEPPAGFPLTGFGWAVAPAGLTEVLVGLRDAYGDRLPPLHVTENGCSYPDREPVPDGSPPRDVERIDYLAAHLRAVLDARTAGVDVRGYHVWSLLDNFEWAEGYGQRFGLVHVDYATQRRTPRASYHWLRDLVARVGERSGD